MFLVACPSCYGENLPVFQLLCVGIPSSQRAKAEEALREKNGFSVGILIGEKC